MYICMLKLRFNTQVLNILQVHRNNYCHSSVEIIVYVQNRLTVVTARMLSVTNLKYQQSNPSQCIERVVLHTRSYTSCVRTVQHCTTVHSASLYTAFAKLAKFHLML